MLANMCWHILKYNGTWLINLCKYSRLLYYTSDLRVKVYATYSSIIPAVASRACYELPLRYTRVTSLVLHINKIRMSSCLFVCLFVLKLLLGKSIFIDESYIAGCAIVREPMLSIFEPHMITWKENIPKKLILVLLTFLIFSVLENAVFCFIILYFKKS